MVEQKENKGFRIIEAVVAIVFILFALSYLNGSANNSSNSVKHNISKELTLSQEIAVVSTESQVIPAINLDFFKTRFPVEKTGSIIASENKKIESLLILQRLRSLQKVISPVFVCYRHVFPPENDEVPLAC